MQGSRRPLSSAGDVVFSEGDKGDAMYVVRSGELIIEKGGKVMETVGPGGVFGEMALIDGSPRVATVRAKTDCEVAPINEKSFLFLVHETPLLRRRRDAHACRPAAAYERGVLDRDGRKVLIRPIFCPFIAAGPRP